MTQHENDDGRELLEEDGTPFSDEIRFVHFHYLATKYSNDRINAYPSIGDQLDMIYHAGAGGEEFQAAIKAVKDAHPKPEE